jgi:hypothetical protein
LSFKSALARTTRYTGCGQTPRGLELLDALHDAVHEVVDRLAVAEDEAVGEVRMLVVAVHEHLRHQLRYQSEVSQSGVVVVVSDEEE